MLRYSAIGPCGSEQQTVLITCWASPQGDEDHSAAMNRMVEEVGFSCKKQSAPRPGYP